MPDQKDVLTTILKDLQISVYSKAANISSNNVETNADSLKNIQHDKVPGFKNNEENIANGSYLNGDFFSSVHISTPKSKNYKAGGKSFSFFSKNTCVTNLFEKGNHWHNQDASETPENPFSNEKILQLCDEDRLLTVEKVMKERIENMQETGRIIHESLEHLWQAKQEEANAKRLLLEQKILDDINEQKLKNQPIREAQLAEDNMRNAQRVLDRIQRVKDAENEALKKSEALKIYRKLRDRIYECQKEYADHYMEVYSIISSYENKNKLMEKSLSTLKDLKNLSTEYERLFKKNKTNELTEEDVNAFIKLVEMVKVICKTLKKDVEDITAEEKIVPEVKAEEEKMVEAVALKSDAADSNPPVEQPDLSDCFDSQSLQTYLSLKSYMQNFEKSCKNIMEDNSMKQFRFNCQKAVTIPVNAISPVSGSHLSDKYIKMYNLLSGKVVDFGGVQLSASQHPEGIAYCKKLLAKKFVRQGELTVSSKPDAAFSIAAVLASLWVDFPDFGKLTLAYFQNFCPYLAPVFMPQVDGQSVEDYHKSLGYNYTENGEVEKQDSFLKRMSGIMRLYAAVLITKVRQPGKRNPLGVAEGWRWIAALLNLEPRPDICATLLHSFLEVAGNEMFRTYGSQFKKLLAYICQVYYPKLEKITPASSGGPIVRLEEFLQKIMKNEKIPSPEGLLPPNFW